eukprot:12720124-Ditylum_brightwellii.AAC.2
MQSSIVHTWRTRTGKYATGAEFIQRHCLCQTSAALMETTLAHAYYNDEPPDRLMSETSQDWPQQGKLSSTSWKIYTGILTKILCRADSRLQKPLEKWLQDDPKWNWRMGSNKDTLFHRHHQEWFIHKLIHQKCTTMIFNSHSTKVILPNNTIPVPEVVQTEDTITCTQG